MNNDGFNDVIVGAYGGYGQAFLYIGGVDTSNGGNPLKRLYLKALIEGFYNAGTSLLIADTVRVYLHRSSPPYNITDSGKAKLDSNGNADFIFRNISGSTNYYVHLNHRNSVETWSDSARSFAGNALELDFTVSASRAFGNNMIMVDASPVRFAVYGGDVNQDGTVDATDVSAIDNDASNFVSGYVVTDLTGDNFVDGTDFAIADNNAANFVSVISP